MKTCGNKRGFPGRRCGRKGVVELSCGWTKKTIVACKDCQHDWAYTSPVTQYAAAGYLKVRELNKKEGQ